MGGNNMFNIFTLRKVSKMFQQGQLKIKDRSMTRYNVTEVTIIMHDIKIICCEILTMIVNIRYNFRISLFLAKFKEAQMLEEQENKQQQQLPQQS
jgi:hypothetical protein